MPRSRRTHPSRRTLWLVAALAAAAAGCQSAMDNVYYGAMERLGQEKRHILRNRVQDGQEEQREAQEQFKSAYERFKSVTGHDGGDLEKIYNELNGEFERSEERAQDVRDRIESIESVAADMFAEWETEIGQISSASMRSESQRTLGRTRTNYATLISAMKRAEQKMDPVLTAFRDRVLFLKHNLNAQAIASLSGSVREIEGDVAALLRDMDASIQEAETFLASMPRS